MNEGMIIQEHYDYFTSCNIPTPPGIGIKEEFSAEIASETPPGDFLFNFFCKC